MDEHSADTVDASLTLTIRFAASDDAPASRAVMQSAAARTAAKLYEMLMYLACSSIGEASEAEGVAAPGSYDAEIVLIAGPYTLHQRKPGEAALH